MATIEAASPAENYNHQETEARIAAFWQQQRIYDFDPTSAKPVYSIDTPPPYVSAAHLHVGHAMSYAQAEFVVRYRRMRGYSIFYPMGFDDNGLPTERFVEKKYGVNRHTITRSKFRELCIEETRQGARVYEEMWRSLGLSVDWRLAYSTIDSLSRATAQKSFLDLFAKGLVYRANEPVLWDTSDETSLAQADLETIERKSKLYDISFASPDGGNVTIATSRPELIPGCVALFHHPDDSRYAALKGRSVTVPLFGYDVPVLQSDEVDPAFGTGLMMVCTFGDGEDVKKWRAHGLPTRIVISANGRMTELAGPYAGLQVTQARSAVVADLKSAGLVTGERSVDQAVSVAERSGQPVEFQLTRQWFIRVLDFKEAFLARSQQLDWRPAHMKTRLDHWIQGLKFDWNISRQRFYGVPFPVWYVQETGDVVVANAADLPVDPTEDPPPAWAREKYAGLTLVGEADVMDTWMTSSLSPLINMNWAERQGRLGSPTLLPMSVRVQAFEIIRTWLFYTLVKSHFHQDQLPWRTVMISGWGLNEQGKKISKRDLDSYTDASGFNRYDPGSVIERSGADALRYWAAGARLGHDLRYNEKDVRAGRKLVVKLWNVARLCSMYLEGFAATDHSVALADRVLEDRWLMTRLSALVTQMTDSFESYDYAIGREAFEKFFWNVYCDDYLEIIKERFWKLERFDERSRRSAQSTLWDSLRMVIGLGAPFIPFVTEDIFLRLFAAHETALSLHVSDWPTATPSCLDAAEEAQMQAVLQLLNAWRLVRSREKIFTRALSCITLQADPESQALLRGQEDTILAALRCDSFAFGEGTLETGNPDWRLAVELGEQPTDRVAAVDD